jgi:hypothetical protein
MFFLEDSLEFKLIIKDIGLRMCSKCGLFHGFKVLTMSVNLNNNIDARC